MSSLFSILNMNTQSMFAAQTGVSVTSHNIANINTPGFSRQSAVLGTRAATLDRGGIYLGRGVTIDGISSVQDRYLNYQVNLNKFSLGQYEAQLSGNDMLQEIINNVEGSGISDKISAFFAAVQNLSTNPEGQAERYAVVSTGESLANQINRTSKLIDGVRSSMDQDIRDGITTINTIAEQVAYLNTKIAEIEGTGQHAGDYRSQRSALLTDLAEYVDFHEYEDENGMVTVYLAGGMPLVANDKAMSLEAVNDTTDNRMARINFVDSNGNFTDITEQIEGGTLRGALDVRDGQALTMKNNLDELAFELCSGVNQIHSTGYGLDGSTGYDFFSNVGTDAAGAAERIGVNQTIADNVDLIAASQDATAVGDNRNALALAELETALTMKGGTWTYADYYSSMVGNVGNAASESRTSYEHQQLVTDQMINFRESVVGVSMEEEMASLIKFQETYEASAKMVQTVDEMLDTLMNLR